MTLNIRTHYYFPINLIALGWGMIMGGIMASITLPLYYLLLVPLGFLFAFTHYRLKVDFENKVYQEYLWLLGIRIGKPLPFESVQYLFLNTAAYAYEYGNIAVRSFATEKNIQGYLKLDDDTKLFVTESPRKERVFRRLAKISVDFEVPIKPLEE